MIFEGTQPTFTHVPPSVPSSMRVTWAPSSAARMAQAKAAEPLPMMATCSPAPSPPARDLAMGASGFFPFFRSLVPKPLAFTTCKRASMVRLLGASTCAVPAS